MTYSPYRSHSYAPTPENPFSWSFGDAPTVLPVSVADAKLRARVDSQREDGAVQDWIRTAVEWIEATRDTQLINRTAVLAYDRWPHSTLLNPWSSILVPRWPVHSVQSIQYVDTTGNLQTWDTSQYTIDLAHKPCRIQPAYGICYPPLRSQQSAVTVNLTLGYGTNGSSVPSVYKQAIYLKVRESYEREEGQFADVTEAVDKLLGSASWGSEL